jgi:uncharacterized protein
MRSGRSRSIRSVSFTASSGAGRTDCRRSPPASAFRRRPCRDPWRSWSSSASCSGRFPGGRCARDSKRSRYRIADPFLRSWFRFVDPERSRLQAGEVDAIARRVEEGWPHHLGEAWEDLARESVVRLELFERRWRPAARWWGPGADHRPLEIDVVAESAEDPDTVLCGEVKRSATSADVRRAIDEVRAKAGRCPALSGKVVLVCVWILRRKGAVRRKEVVGASAVLEASVARGT